MVAKQSRQPEQAIEDAKEPGKLNNKGITDDTEKKLESLDYA